MTYERGVGFGNKMKSRAVALGLGLAALLPTMAPVTYAKDTLKPTWGALGYKSKAEHMNYQDIIDSVDSPKEAIFYRDNCIPYAKDKEVYGVSDYWASFKQIHQKGRDDCDGVAVAMAALMTHAGYAPQVLWLKRPVSPVEQMFRNMGGDKEGAKEDNAYHLIYPYQDKHTGKWGCIGVNQTEDRDPNYNSLEDMVKTLKVAWLPKGANTYQINDSEFPHGLQNLDKSYGRDLWISGDVNLANLKRSNVAQSYNYDIYKFMRDRISKQGYKAVSEKELVTEVVKAGLCSAITAESHFSMAYTSVKDEVETLVAMMNQKKQQVPVSTSTAGAVAANK